MAVTQIVVFIFLGVVQCKAMLNPVVLVPGLGGSQIRARLNKPHAVASYCKKRTQSFTDLWLDIKQLTFLWINCFLDNMRLEYDNVTRTTKNSPGVETMIPGFGTTETVEYLDSVKIPLTKYFNDIVQAMVKWGYKRNVLVFGAPYDFRKAPNELKGYLTALQQLIERAYYKNKNQRVYIITHSMGSPVTLYLLNRMTQAWKDKFIMGFISLAGVWGGALKPIRLMITGDSLHIPLINPLKTRRMQRSMTSTAWLMPSDEFWKPDEVLVVTPARNYTVRDYKQLFKDIDYETGYMIWEDTKGLVNPLQAPQVEMHCLHGVDVPTAGRFLYDKSTWLKKNPKYIKDNGDGTVNIRSLLGCLRLQDQQNQTVYHKTFHGVEHLDILHHKDVIAYIKGVLIKK
ncbi:phospholipase A2 group XV-like [Dreissena polymorpha]|nr:phospholipase A2 group XV-like [Dreissena polymorpha]